MKNSIYRQLRRGTSTLALVAAASAFAGTAMAQTGEQVESVVVSSSRITTTGFNAPTPTTVVGTDMIEAQAQPNIFNTIIELPSLMGSQSLGTDGAGTSGGTNGVSSFSLLGLGTIRTLTLLDGQRVVPANVQGLVDVSEFPQLLVSRVDVVTGGASASWGSDAVGGVVNFVTNKTFTGFKANIQGGISSYADNMTGTVQMAAGTGFDGGKGHIEGSFEYSHTDGVPSGIVGGVGQGALPNGRTWWTQPTLMQRTIAATPAGQPQYVVAQNVQDYQTARYGIITAGPLQGIAFQADSTPYNFNYGSGGVPQRNAAGTVVSPNPANCIAPFCVGGDLSGVLGGGVTLTSPSTRGDIYLRASYDLFSNLTIWGTLNLAEVGASNIPNPTAWKQGNLTIQCTNAYLAAALKTACATNNITSFAFGSAFANLGPQYVHSNRDQRRYTVGTDGSFQLLGTDWTWSSYYEHGENNTRINVANETLTPYLNASIDAVSNAQGVVVCRSAAAQALGCVPFNPFGNTQATPAQRTWLYGGDYFPGPQQNTHEKQDAASISFNSEPFKNWAGPVSFATGAEYRQEGYHVVGDPASAGGTNNALLNTNGSNWYAGNFHNGSGSYRVWEGFMEVVLPLVNNADWGKADLDVAGRATGYSTSGYVQTWKVGVTWDTPIDGIRLRALQSRDVRAPNLSELFAAANVTNNTATDPFTGTLHPQQQIQNVTTGNLLLQPEKSANTQLGIVWQPTWIPGFSSSVDYYRVGLKGQIGSGVSPILLCQQGYQQGCNAILTVGGVDPRDPAAVWTQVLNQPFNIASTVTDGFNIETSYQFSLQDWQVPGDFTVRLLATHVSKFITNSGVPGTIPSESAGTNAGSIPHWKALATQTYDTGKWNITFSENFVSDGVFNRAYVQCTTGCPLPTANNPTVNQNSIPGQILLDIGSSYHLDDNWQAYVKVDNVADTPPPPIWFSSLQSGTDGQFLYDVVGRMFHVGVRANF
jgi:iron complex outermembrane receptor protein